MTAAAHRVGASRTAVRLLRKGAQATERSRRRPVVWALAEIGNSKRQIIRGQKKKERSLWDLLDSLGQNDAQLRVKLVMNVGLKLEITKNKPRGIHRQRGRQKSRMQGTGTQTRPPVGRGPRVPRAAGSPHTASCSDVTDGTGTRAPTLVGGGKAPENATWHSACEGGGFRRARGAEGRGLMAGGGRSTSEQDLL